MSYRLVDAVWDLPDEAYGLNVRLYGGRRLLSCQSVLLVVCRYAKDDGTGSRPGVARIARQARLNARTVMSTLADLEHAGLIRAVAYREGGRGHATEWVVTLPDPEKACRYIQGLDPETLQVATGFGPETLQVPAINPVGTYTKTLQVPTPQPVIEPVIDPVIDPVRGADAPPSTRKTSPLGLVIQRIREGGGEVIPTSRDGKALKDSGADPEQVADFYLKVFRGDLGDDWLRSNLSIHAVISRLTGLKLSRTNGHARVPRTGHLAESCANFGRRL
jgi:hypothetical protein